jgi:O-antigen/teichoic acid export membrane protein
MIHPEESPNPGFPIRWGRSRFAKAAVIYFVLAGLGIGVLLEFAPGLFDFSELTEVRLLALAALLIFAMAPAVAVVYILLSALFEALVMGVGWVFETCFRAVVRFLRRALRGDGE